MQPLLMFLLCLVPVEHNDLANKPDTLVVCPDAFQEELKSWIDYRQSQGHVIRVLSPPERADQLQFAIRNEASENPKLKWVFLVGDSQGEKNTVPTAYINAEVNILYGAQPKIATDNCYADLDDDGIPELAIGRLPVDKASELKAAVQRIVEYEKSGFGPWLKRINFVAGVGGFGQLVDKLIEQTAKKMITEMIPSGYETTMTYGSWNSPYCPDPRRFAETSIQKFNEGCLFWVYIGHGSTHSLDKIRLPDRSYRILDYSNVGNLQSVEGNPIAVFLACNTAGFDNEIDCLAEKMLEQESGPIAIIASTRVSMPYAMSIFTLEMTRDYFGDGPDTLGEIVRNAKKRLVTNDNDDSNFRQIIEAMGQSFSPRPELLVAERKEHAYLMQYLGDPLLKVKRPKVIDLNAEIKNGVVEVAGEAAFDGKLELVLSYRRDRFRFRPPRRREYDPADFGDYQEAYEKAQQLDCSTHTVSVSAGKITAQIPIPETAKGECVVRAMLVGESEFAIGSAPIKLPAK